MPRMPERRKDRARRQILEMLKDPVLIQFARERKEAKEIVLSLFGSEIAAMRASAGSQRAEKLFRTKVRWVERRIMGAL